MSDSKNKKYQRIKITNRLDQKVGVGGLSQETLLKADRVCKNFSFDLTPHAQADIEQLQTLIKNLEINDTPITQENKDQLMRPVVSIKANAGLFHYQLLSQVAETTLFFIDYITEINKDSLQILLFQAHILTRIIDNAKPEKINAMGFQLLKEIDDAVNRYRKKYPHA